LLKKYDVEKNGYVDYLINFSFSGQFLPVEKGGNINNGFFPKNMKFYEI